MKDIQILLSYLIAKESLSPSSSEPLQIVFTELSDTSLLKLIEAPTSPEMVLKVAKSVLRGRILVTAN